MGTARTLALIFVAVFAETAGAEKGTVRRMDENSKFKAGAVRYQVKNVNRSIEFYTKNLGFKVEQQSGPAFGKVSNGNLSLWLSGPESSGSRPMPNGKKQEPGGWNRIVLEVQDLPNCVAAMKKSGLTFRSEIVTGPGGKQIQLEDPDGNPVEIFEPAAAPK